MLCLSLIYGVVDPNVAMDQRCVTFGTREITIRSYETANRIKEALVSKPVEDILVDVFWYDELQGFEVLAAPA